MQLSQLKWRCRRGMRELDVLLEAYLSHHYPVADTAEQADFVSLVALTDPELSAYLLQGQDPTTPDLQRLVEKIRHFC